ncbi:BT_3928 family protein [Dysgonomonas sp. 25]|uniref:BT_3928 family protein n=1 Tax=Dysgonomonas sp. 25 TaxID=2302933 RepID=UPI0013D65339|nr:BT_3928 family protein [Dysgonomonas sp. 25]NDV69058.1 DoxX family protein [Dysgonomonas sp. 25]
MEKEKSGVGMKILVEVARVLLGATFVFSGFVKSVDPMGTVYQIEDYLIAFHLSALLPMAVPVAFFLCGLEFVMGVCMLLGLYRKWNSRLMLVVMVFMTILTLYLAIANPVKDCGCFGDAVKLTNWQTFYKNIVLLAFAIIVFVYHERIKNIFTGKTYWMAFLYTLLFTVAFLIYNYRYDPVVDFRPYRIGNNIPELMKLPPDAKQHIAQSVLVYEKDGVEQEFTEENYPWEDESWTFVRMDTKTIQEGDEPPIADFKIVELLFDDDTSDAYAEADITEEVLADTGYVFLMISPVLQDMSQSYISHFEDVLNYSNDYHYKFYCLTSSTVNDIRAWEKENAVDLNFCRTDERALKTIIRTNPGLLLIRNGVIINKWADVYVPAEENLTAPLQSLPYSKMIDQKEEDIKNILWVSAIFILPLLLIKGFDFGLFRRREEELRERKTKKKDN